MPEEVVQRCRAMVEQQNQRTQQSEIESANLLQDLRELYAQEITGQGEPLDTLDNEGLLRWAMERYGSKMRLAAQTSVVSRTESAICPCISSGWGS